MATTSFGAKVTDLVGTTALDTDALDDWLSEAVIEIMNIAPDRFLYKCSSITELADGNGMDLDGKGKIIDVTRNDADTSGKKQPCRQVNSKFIGRVGDSEDLLFYATVTDPVFIVQQSILYVFPTPTSNQKAYIQHLSYPTVAYGDNSITNFPDEAEYVIVLYAAMKQAAQNMQAELDNEDSELYGMWSQRYQMLTQDYQRGLAGFAKQSGGRR
jgi:hypothetical protein